MIRKFKTLSDRGSVLVGNDNWKCAIANGYGDGISTVYIADTYEETSNIEKEYGHTFSCLTVCQGEFNIYSCDCGEEADIIASLKGEYNVCIWQGIVIFSKIN